MNGTPLVLVGLRCTGKSTVGRLLADRFGVPFVDTDAWIAERAGAAHAGDVLAERGEEAFRDLEEQALAAVLGDGTDSDGPADAGASNPSRLAPLAREPSLVVATGGGIVERASNRARLAAARVVWLRAEPEVLVERQLADPAPRPSLASSPPGADLLTEVRALAARRAPWFAEVATEELDATRSPRDLVDHLA